MDCTRPRNSLSEVFLDVGDLGWNGFNLRFGTTTCKERCSQSVAGMPSTRSDCMLWELKVTWFLN